MKNLLVSENSWNNSFFIASIILLQLTPGIQKKLSLKRSMMEIQFLISVQLFFIFISHVKKKEELFLTSISTVLHFQTVLCRYLYS